MCVCVYVHVCVCVCVSLSAGVGETCTSSGLVHWSCGSTALLREGPSLILFGKSADLVPFVATDIWLLLFPDTPPCRGPHNKDLEVKRKEREREDERETRYNARYGSSYDSRYI